VTANDNQQRDGVLPSLNTATGETKPRSHEWQVRMLPFGTDVITRQMDKAMKTAGLQRGLRA
jgi:hypothetical protein